MEAFAHLRGETRYAVVVTEVSMPGGVSGLEVDAQVAQAQPDARVLVVSGLQRSQLPPIPAPAPGAMPFLEEVPEWARKRLLGQRDERPMKQRIVEENGRLVARFRPSPLDEDSDAVALVQSMQQVRNNLFHGGKEDSEEDPYAEDDDWVYAATQVALALQRALVSGSLDGRP